MPPHARYTWRSASPLWKKGLFRLRSRIQDLIPLALRFKWHPMSQVRGRKVHYLWWHLSNEQSTIFIGGSEIILNSFDDICLDILFFFESDGSSVDELTIFILCDCRRARRLDLTFLNFSGKECDSSDDICQHIDDINWLIKKQYVSSLIIIHHIFTIFNIKGT